ncbi:unnamed protein product, partial [marine sediment metagenome]
ATSATDKAHVTPHQPTEFEVIEALYEEVSEIENPNRCGG